MSNMESALEVGKQMINSVKWSIASLKRFEKSRGGGEASESWCRAPPTAPEWFDSESFVTLP